MSIAESESPRNPANALPVFMTNNESLFSMSTGPHDGYDINANTINGRVTDAGAREVRRGFEIRTSSRRKQVLGAMMKASVSRRFNAIAVIAVGGSQSSDSLARIKLPGIGLAYRAPRRMQ